MARLIDADALKRKLHDSFEESATEEQTQEERFLEMLIRGLFDSAVDTAPTVEAVEVVRCKDCKYLLKDNTARESHLCMQNRYTRRNVNLDDYCSYGEKGGTE